MTDTPNKTIVTTSTGNRIGNPGKGKEIPLELLVDMHIRQKMNVTEIARALNIHHTTVSKRLKRTGISTLDLFKANKKNILIKHQKDILDSVSSRDLKRAGLRDKYVAVGVLEDKIEGRTGELSFNLQINLIEQIYDSRFKARPLDMGSEPPIETVANQATTEVPDNEGEK